MTWPPKGLLTSGGTRRHIVVVVTWEPTACVTAVHHVRYIAHAVNIACVDSWHPLVVQVFSMIEGVDQ